MAPNSPFGTVNGYGNASPSVFVDPASGLTSGYVDTADGFPTLHPQLNPSGGLAAFVIDPVPILPYIGMPEINAILIECRVLSALIREQMGDTKFSYDLQSLRADEAWNTNITTGAL